MKLIAHQIWKDTRELGSSIAVWLGSGAYLIYVGESRTGAPDHSIQLFFTFVAMTLVGVLTCTLAAKVSQVDSPLDVSAFWRTRPISPGRLIVAKGLLVGIVFVLVPALAILLAKKGDAQITELPHHLLTWAAIAAGSMGLGSCTKDSSRFMLAAFLSIIGVVALRKILGYFSMTGQLLHPWLDVVPRLNPVTATKISEGYVLLIGIAILLCRYLWNLRIAPVVLATAGVVGVALLSKL